METLKALKEIDPKIEVIMATGYATIETAIESMKLGAYDFIAKPFRVEDITRLLERALEKRRLSKQVDKLQEINRFKSEFLANMSHELRTPMNAIIGYTSLILDKVYGDIPEKQEQVLKRVDANAKNLLQLINNILDISKISAGKMPVYMEEFNLKELLREGDSQIALKVKDPGIGIKSEDLTLLFQEFRQLDSSSAREFGGTGLGPAITKKLAELIEKLGSLAEKSRKKPSEGDGRKKVLVVDDDKSIVVFLKSVLEHIEKASRELKNMRIVILTAKYLTPQETEYLQSRAEMIVQKGSKSHTEILRALKERLSVVEGAEKKA